MAAKAEASVSHAKNTGTLLDQHSYDKIAIALTIFKNHDPNLRQLMFGECKFLFQFTLMLRCGEITLKQVRSDRESG